jgi:hypothetical protein
LSRRLAPAAKLIAIFTKKRICRELGNPQGLSILLANQADLLKGFPGRIGEARGLAEKALGIATSHGYQ